MKRSRWISLVLLLAAVSPLVGCGQALENALSPDPEVKTWSGQGQDPQKSKTGQTPKPADPLVADPSAELIQSTPPSFADLDQAPENLQTYINDLARLEVLNPASETAEGDPLFLPNQPIKRGVFVRWLVETNNRLNRDRPTRQFRLASAETSTPAYQDVPKTHPDFAYIQGLAEAGYLPSSLTGDATETQFRPDADLTRETLLQWKVPIDQQKLLPTVTPAKVQEVWGFKDASKVSPKAASAVVADHSNGDLSNIRRLVGASLLLQPQKPVTRAEAAAALWYVGIEGQGYSAQDIVRAQVQAEAAQKTKPPAQPDSPSSPSPSPSPSPNTITDTPPGQAQ